MNEGSMLSARPIWTWADQISTYRFWGISLFYFLSAISIGMLTTFWAVFFTSSLGLGTQQLGVIYTVLSASGIFGLYFGWAATRYHAKALLIVAGVMQLVGGLLMTVPSLATVSVLRIMGAFLCGLGTGAITLAVPSILANGRGGSQAFVIAFGIVYTCAAIGRMQAAVIGGVLWQNLGDIGFAAAVATYVVLGLLLLLPVNPSLFEGAPRQRGYALPPVQRDPVVVAVCCFIPFYWLYWLYRAHGEVATVAPSRSILSPHASWLASVFVPLFYPIVITSLIDALNMRATELGKPAYRQPWAIFLWSFVFLPAAMGLVQSALNKAAMEISHGAPTMAVPGSATV